MLPTLPRVYGEGPLSAKIAIIGEAPGSTEVKYGRPFVGASGQLLGQIMQNVGLARSDCYVTNVVKRQPRNNEIDELITFKGTTAIPTAEYNDWEQLLYKELASCEANVLVGLGKTALYALTRKTGITAWRGSILEGVEAVGRKKVICTYHPAAALREYLFVYPMASDLRRVGNEQHSPKITRLVRNIKLYPSFKEALDYIHECFFLPEVGFDIEVYNEEVGCFSLAKTPFDAICIPFMSTGQNYFSPPQELDVLRELAALLESPATRKITQNGSFDCSFLLNRYGIQAQKIEDTMIAQAVLAPEMPKGLDFLCSIYTEQTYYKDDGKRYFKLQGSQEDFFRYNALDSLVTLEAFPKIKEKVHEIGNDSVYNVHRDLIPVLMFMHKRGFRMDIAGLAKGREDTIEKIAEVEKELRTYVGDINLSSPMQLADYFFHKKGLRSVKKTDSGKDSTDEEVLKRLAGRGVKEASLIIKYRGLMKMLTSYYEIKLDDDQRLRTSFNPVGTKNGRLSSGKTIFGTGANMQNIPKPFRKYMLADEGYVLVNIDLAKAENKVVAYIAPDENMIHAFEAGIDLHKLTASLIFRKPIEEISDAPGSCSIGSGEFSERDWGKKANHGLNYGLSYNYFSRLYEISLNEAKFIIDGYKRAYPGVDRYHEWVRSELQRTRTLTNCYGRKRIFLGRWDEDMHKEGYSFIPASTVADKMNRDGLLYIWNNQDLFPEIEMLIQVHDSVGFQIPLSAGWAKISNYIAMVVNSLEQPLHFHGRDFVINADVGIGKNFKDLAAVKGSKLRDPKHIQALFEGIA